MRYLFISKIKQRLILLLPLILFVGFILVLKHTLGNQFPYNAMIPKTIMFLFLAFASFVIIKKENYALTISLLSASLLSATIWMMFGAETILGGRGGDNGFSMVLVARFMNESATEDIVYSGLSNFYPFYFHYGIAKLAILFDWSYYKALKYGAFLTIYFMPIMSYYLWRKIAKAPIAFLMALASLFAISISMYFRKSYEVIPLILIVPWWIYYFCISEKKLQYALIGGIIGGLLFGTYYYWFFPIVLASTYLIVVDFVSFKKYYRYYAIFFIALLFSASPYLFPYIYDLLHYGSEPFQNRYFRASHLNFPLQTINSLKDFIFLSGLLYVVAFRHKKVERYLFLLIISTYTWIFLGHIGIISDIPLLTMKIIPFVHLLLSLSFALLVNEIIARLTPHTPHIRSSLSIGMILLMVIPLFTQLSYAYKSKDLKAAKAFQKNVKLQDTKLRSYIDGKTILAARSRMTMSLDTPTHFFTAWSACFSHPSALLSQRLIFLKLLSYSKNHKFITWILKNNRFTPIEYVWFKNKKFDIDYDNFPKENPQNRIYITFNDDFFKSLKPIEEYPELFQVPTETNITMSSLGTLEKHILYHYGTSLNKNRTHKSIFVHNKKLFYLDSVCKKSKLKDKFFWETYTTNNKNPEIVDFNFDGLSGKHSCLMIKELPSNSIEKLKIGQRHKNNNWEITLEKNKFSTL